MKWLKHAFAIESPDALEVTGEQRALVDRLSGEVVRRRMTSPALLLLEMHRPFNYVSAQLMHFFQPILSILTDTDGYEQFAHFLERRGSIDYLIGRIEALQSEDSSGGSSKSAPRPSDPIAEQSQPQHEDD